MSDGLGSLRVKPGLLLVCRILYVVDIQRRTKIYDERKPATAMMLAHSKTAECTGLTY